MRESGILMPVSSLPGPYGIGCFGKAALEFVDFLAEAGQTIWQILPLSPTGYGDSPYQSCSAFAGNPYFIDLDALKAEGLLTAAQLKAEEWGENPLEVDYGTLYTSRYKVLRTAYQAWREQCAGQHGCAFYYPDDYYAFTLANEAWLEDYALYMALKTEHQMKSWTDWPREYRTRDAGALARFRAAHEEEIGFWKFLQYKFDTQWKAVKDYANAKGVKILGDIPIYVSADSVDAWVGGPLFELDGEGRFARVAGCPPDYFSADGQLWGNPLYHWPYHKQTGYAWWVQRVRHALGIYDLLRIDHFRGFDTYWAIPAGSSTACNGKWEIGPRMDLFNALEAALGKLPIIAEDLGELVPSVRELLADKIRAYEEKGQNRVIRVMILGIPNVGKSTFINKIAGRKTAKTEDRPGVTRAKQWVPIDKNLELLDTPGILWPKFEDQSVGLNLAYTGAVKDDILDTETLGCHLMAYLGERYPQALSAAYKLPGIPEREDEENDVAWGYRLLCAAGKKRGFLISGGDVDTERMAKILLDEFRSGKLGRFTLELPESV